MTFRRMDHLGDLPPKHASFRMYVATAAYLLLVDSYNSILRPGTVPVL